MNLDINLFILLLFLPSAVTCLFITFTGIHWLNGGTTGLALIFEAPITEKRKIPPLEKIIYLTIITVPLLILLADLCIFNIVDFLSKDGIEVLITICEIPIAILTIIVGSTFTVTNPKDLDQFGTRKEIILFTGFVWLWFYTAFIHIGIFMYFIDPTGETFRNMFVL